MEEILSQIFDFVSSIPVGLILVFVFISGMYIFWRGCMETGKDRSSIFDVYTISLLLSIGISRVGYIISNMGDFTGYIWYWSPYEKYGDVIYMFRLLPWRFFRIWDGGIVILSLFVGYILFSSIYTLFIKKWRWKQMLFPIHFSSIFLFSLSLIFTASIGRNTNLLITALVPLAFVLASSVLSLIVSRNKNMKWKKRKKIVSYVGIISFILTTAYISYEVLIDNISLVEQISIYVLDVWALLASLLYIVDIKRKKSIIIEKVSEVQGISLPEINQPIRLPSNEKKK